MYLVTFHQCSCQCSQNDRVEQCSFVLAKYKILPMVEGVFTSSTQVKVSLPRYENTPLKALHSKRVKKKRSTLKSHRSDCFHLTYDYIVHTLLWCWGISIFFCRMLQTHNNPPPPPPHTSSSLYSVLLCSLLRWGTDTPGREVLRKGESKAMGESCWVWTSVGPWGNLRKVAGDKAPKMRAKTRAKCSWTLPYSRAQQHPTQHTSPVFPEESHPVIQLYKSQPRKF